MSTIRRLHLALLGLYAFMVTATYPLLPERYPIHYGPSGRADAWADKSPWPWYLLLVIAVAVFGMMTFISTVSVRYPHLWNIPEKQTFLKLSPEQRAPIEAKLRDMLDLVGIFVTLLFITLQGMMLWTALRQVEEFPQSFHLVILGFSFGITALAITQTLKVGKAVRAAAASRPDTGVMR
jgi:uncharacterized membrane protein